MLPVRKPLWPLFLFLLSGPAAAGGQTTWDGGGDGTLWSDAANWDPDGVPDSGTDVLLDGGASIQLDVTAFTHDLVLDNATLDGPGDLTVTGQMDWGLGTVTGDGFLLVTGGMTFLEGPNKIVGRQVELACDTEWEDSHIFFDIAAGGALHHQSGYVFTIVDHEENRPGSESGAESGADFGAASGAESGLVSGADSGAETAEFVTPSGRRILSSHRDAPLVGSDPTADDTDLYVFVLEGTVLANTAVIHDVSTRIGGLYHQTTGATIFGSGSEVSFGGTYRLGNGAEGIFDEGTHVAQGRLEAASGEVPLGISTTGDQTDYFLDPEGIPDTPYSLRGSHTFGETVEISSAVLFDAGTTITGTSPATIERMTLDPSSIELVDIVGILLNVNELIWNNGQFRLCDGSSIQVNQMTIDQTNTNLTLFDDGDDNDTESITINDRLHVLRTGSVAPRIEVDMGFPNGRRLDMEDGTGLVFRGNSQMGARIAIGTGGILCLDKGLHEITTAAELRGPGTVKISQDATATVGLPQFADIEAILLGTLKPTGNVDVPGLRVTVDGGTIEGNGSETSSLGAQYAFNPGSSVRRAKVTNTTARLLDGSTWRNGHIDFLQGAKGVVTAGASFVVSHTATNLQMTEDGDTGTEEKLIVQGTLTIDQSASVPAYLNVPTNVTSSGEIVVEAGQKLTVPNQMTVKGGLTVREGASVSFRFEESEVDPEGFLAGNGSITQSQNGKLVLNGTVDPGDGPGEIGQLEVTGVAEFGPTSTTVFDMKKEGDDPLQSDRLVVNNGITIDGTASFNVDASGPFGEVVNIVDGVPIIGVWDVVMSGASTVDLNYNGTNVSAEITRDPQTKSVVGYVQHNIDLGNSGSYPAVPGIQIELVADEGNGAVVATATTNESGVFIIRGSFDGIYLVRVVLDSEVWLPFKPATASTLIDLTEVDVPDIVGFDVRRPFEEVVVTNTDESGPGSLRDAIETANLNAAASVDIDISALQGTIFFASPLPILQKPARIMSLAPGNRSGGDSPVAGGEPRLVLDGSNCTDCNGLVLSGGESAIRNLAIENFDGYGLVIEESTHTFVNDTRIAGNGLGGVLIGSGNGNRVGVDSGGVPNEITMNGGPGITVLGGMDHDLQGNINFGNIGLAIDLGGEGPTANDTRDIDAGPNDLQNAPFLTSADPLGLDVQGTLESRPLAEYRIEVYGSDVCPEGDRGDLQVLLGSALVMTDIDGFVDFVVETLPFAGQLSAIATSESGSTSEVSPCFQSVVTDVSVSGIEHDLFHRAYPNPSSGPTTLSFRMPFGGEVEASLHDVSGRRVATLFQGDLAAGLHEIEWDGKDSRGRELENGVYFYKLRIGGEEAQGRVVTLR